MTPELSGGRPQHRQASWIGADGPHPVPVELGILGHLLSPSLDVLPVLLKCLCCPSLHLVKVGREPEEKIV